MTKQKPAQIDSDEINTAEGDITHVQPHEAGSDEMAATSEAVSGEIVPSGNAVATRGPASPASDVQDLAEISPESKAALDRLMGWLDNNRDRTASPDAAVADIIAQIMSSDSVDEVLAEATAVGLRELLDIPIRIYGGKFNQSEFEAGLPWYAVMDVERLDNGWRGAVTTGAQSILAQLIRITQLDGFPANVMCVYATKNPTKSGYRPLRLKAVGK